ncbi:MAG: hypothetical protein APR54_03115 [Candidatus Cloacimonas sp. SDB]|nr:MAG: hypothetical protein APR54_03115 [Candidatus Cloacimonas sp. SDB]
MHKSVLILMIVLCGLMLNADDVIDSINEGLDYYKSGDYSSAIESLSYANQLIKQIKGGQLENCFPEPLSGWEASAATSTAAGEAMFGGGVTAERSYTKEDANVQIQFITDSPLMQTVMMMFSNPMFATSDGGKMEKIAGQKAIVKYDENSKSGEIQIAFNNKYLITVNGNYVDRDILVKYTAAIDFNKMSGLQ